MTRPVLVLATSNRGKAVEVQARLPQLEVQTLADHPDIVMPPEDADTFAGNALIKARHVSERLGVPALADDSGLVVDALGGAPGVRSARYAEGTDRDRYEKLLEALAEVPAERRTARFACAMAFVVPGGPQSSVEGFCEGHIGRAPQGDGGFGYDPVFLIEPGRTMAELTTEEKNRVSHRGAALTAVLPHLLAHFSLEQA